VSGFNRTLPVLEVRLHVSIEAVFLGWLQDRLARARAA
jgi:hypothetical protein